MEGLTPSQEAQIGAYKDRFYKVAVCTDAADRVTAEAAIKEIYKFSDLAEPKEFLWVDSPKAAQDAINKDRGTEGSYYPTHSYGYGQNEAAWIAFYKFFEEVVGVKYPEKAKQGLEIMLRIANSCAWWWPFENVCVVSERPKEIHLVTGGNALHNESGPALLYRDGFSVWYLNGVRVNEKLVMTPAEEMDPMDALKEENVEIRREMLRKIGNERFIAKVGGKTVDSDTMEIEGVKHEYELLHVDMGKVVGIAAYLKMKNPSIGVYHIECVGMDDIKTVKDAIFVRNKSRMAPLKLT